MMRVEVQSAVPISVYRWPPLGVQVIAALLLGGAVGAWAGDQPIIGPFGTEQLGRLGMLVIRALKTLAIPLVAFVVLDSLLRFDVPGRQGLRLLRICAANAAVAMVIGVALSNALRPGDHLRSVFASLTNLAGGPSGAPALDPLAGIEALVPTSIVAPFVNNAALPGALLALLLGCALRSARSHRDDAYRAFASLSGTVHLIADAFQQALVWLVRLAPLAAFALVAAAVGKVGLRALSSLWIFVAVIGLGFILHGLIYYPLLAWSLGGKTPRVFLGGARDALVSGIATNSSLATVPVTLKCLTERVGVSAASARLSACLGTNLNNDGIALYEAMAVLVIAQACGYELGIAQQASVVLASIMAGVGIAGIPEAGMVMLPIVLASVGLPETAAAAAIPLVMPVDWILARARTALNVLSDMVVAILLDREPVSATAQEDKHYGG